MTEKAYFRVVTEEIRGGVEKSREFVVTAEDYGKVLYKYHQHIRGVYGYEDTESGDKHTLHKNGNVCGVGDIESIDNKEYLDMKNQGVVELEKQV